MKKALLLTLLFCISVMAHSMLLLINDNGDGTIYIETGLSTGGSAAGADLVIRERASGKPILETKVPEEGNLTVEQPKVAYTVSVSFGEGHRVTRNGPLAGKDKK